MGISDVQFREIMNLYDHKRMVNQQAIDAKVEKLKEEIPAFDALQKEIISLSVTQARDALIHPAEYNPAVYSQRMKELSEKKTALLIQNKYPADFLTPNYDCKDCKDTGYINNKPCHCLRKIKIDFLYRESNLEHVLKEENFGTFRDSFYDNQKIDNTLSITARENIQKLREICQNYIKQFDTDFDNLIFYGDTGVGKSFLSHCIAKELLDSEHAVIYLTAVDFFELLGKNKFRRDMDSSEISQQVAALLSCDLLIIDDLGTELSNSFTDSQLYYFMEHRRQNRRSIIFSTNLSFYDLKERYGDRIFSRFTAYYHFYKLIGDDIRAKKRFL